MYSHNKEKCVILKKKYITTPTHDAKLETIEFGQEF